jgi:hypothetical protein
MFDQAELLSAYLKTASDAERNRLDTSMERDPARLWTGDDS